MTDQSRPSGFVVFIKGLFKLVLAILLGLIIGGAFYLAGNYIYLQAIIPSQNNTIAVKNLKTRYEVQIDQLTGQNADLEERISALEVKLTEQANILDEQRVLLQKNQDEVAELINHQELVLAQMEDFETSLDQLADQQEDLNAENEILSELLAEEEDPALYLYPLQMEVKLLKTMQQLNRSRLFLLQSNYGLAEQELGLALVYLNEMKDIATEKQLNSILLWEARLELIGSHLPEQPALANEDMEILWQLMANGFPEDVQAETAAEDVSSTETTAGDSPEATSTPEPTQTP